VAAGGAGGDGDGAAVAARFTAVQIAKLLDCHPDTVRRWISRFNSEGLAGLADRSPVRAAPVRRPYEMHLMMDALECALPDS
jgi:transposase-like protein